MEAASRPAFEPLADLPVEEPFGLGWKGGALRRHLFYSNTAITSASSSGRHFKSPMDSDEDLLSHGALLDLGPEASESISKRPDRLCLKHGLTQR